MDEVSSSFYTLKEEFNKLFEQAEKHYKIVRNNPLVCDKETSEWLLINNRTIWEKVSKNDGIFIVDTLMKVYDARYINKKIEEIMVHLKDRDLKVIQISKSHIHFSIQNIRYIYAITFIIPIKKFMECIGCYALTDNQYKFGKEDLQDVFIEVTNNNFHAVYNSILEILNKNGYDFVVEEKTEQAYWKKLSQFERKNRWSNHVFQTKPMYKKSSITLFLKMFSLFLLKDEAYLEKNFNVIIKNMESGQRWITQTEKNTNEEVARYARGMQKQKGFIPY